MRSSSFVRLINQPDGICQESGLWSLSVIKTGTLAIHLMQSYRLIILTMAFPFKFIDYSKLGGTFSYVFTTFS